MSSGDVNKLRAALGAVSSKKHKTSLPKVEEKSRQIKYIPYNYSTPGKTEVKARGTTKENTKTFIVNYDPSCIPDPKLTSREKIKLPGANERVIEYAKRFAANYSSALYAEKTAGMLRYHDFTSSRITRFIDKAIEETGFDDLDRKEFETLATFLCVKSERNKLGCLEKLPTGFLNVQDENFQDRLQIIGRYVLVNVLDLGTASEVEGFSGWGTELANNGLRTVVHNFSAPEFLKIIFPGYLDGANPPIREWRIQTTKWKGKREEVLELVTRAAKNAFEAKFPECLVGEINPELILERGWQEMIEAPEYGLGSILQRCPYIRGNLDLIELVVPEFFEAYPRHRFEYQNKWTEEDRLETIDSITTYILEEKLKLLGPDGKVSAAKIKEVRDWFNQYELECSGCLKNSRIGSAYNALKRCYPYLFGWGEEQINPGDISYDGMWDGKEGERLFQLKFAKSIHTIFEKLKMHGIRGFENHSVQFNPDSKYPLLITRRDFLKLRNAYLRTNISWQKHFSVFGLEGGYKKTAGDIMSAFEILLGKLNIGTKEFGDSGIYSFDVESQLSKRQLVVERFTSELDPATVPKSFKIKGFREKAYAECPSGVENTFLSFLNSTARREEAIALYYAYRAALEVPDREGSCALEGMLTSRYKTGEKAGELILSDKNLKTVLELLKNEIIPNTILDETISKKLNDALELLINLPTPLQDIRKILETVLDVAQDSGSSTDLTLITNKILEEVFSILSIYEIRLNKIRGSSSEYCSEVFKDVQMEIEDKSETDDM